MTSTEVQERAVDPPELVAYVEHQRLRNLSPQTITRRSPLLRQLAGWLDGPLKAATLVDLRRFVGSRRDRIAPATHFGDISVLKAFYSALVELDWIEVSPATGLHCKQVRSPRRPISLERVREIFVEAGQLRGEPTPLAVALAKRDRACLELLFATGMRASEVGATRVVDVDLRDASVLVRRAKRGHSRRLPLPPSAVEAIQLYLDESRAVLLGEGHDDEGRLFLNNLGRPLSRSCLHQLVARASKRCGAPTYPHAFRRTLATELARNGASLPVIQEVLGHAHLTTTAAYVEVDVVDMRAPLELLDRQRPKSHTEPAYLDNLQCQLFLGWQYEAASGSSAPSAADPRYTASSKRVA